MGNDGDAAQWPNSALSALRARSDQARSQAVAFDNWRRRLTAELIELPDTLANLRTGAANFEVVGRRLSDASASLEAIANLYETTIADSARRSAGAAEALQKQLDNISKQSSSGARATAADLQQAFEALIDMNPFIPKPSRSRDRPPG